MDIRTTLEAFRNMFRVPELRRRILFTVSIIAIYRLGTFVPIPGVNFQVLERYFAELEQAAGGGFLSVFNLFTGGAFGRLSIFALGIMPYITTSIMMQLMTTVIPTLEKLAKEGEAGRRKINQYTRYGTIIICLVQGLGMIAMVTRLEVDIQARFGVPLITVSGVFFTFLAVMTWTTGTMFLMWLGDQISDRGIGNGISLLIFASIVERVPSLIGNIVVMVQTGQLSLPLVVVFLVVLIALIAGVVWLQVSHRKIPIQYAQRMVGRRIYGGQNTYLPLKVDYSGVIAIIFAQAVLQFPQMFLEPLKGSAFFGGLHSFLNNPVIYNGLFFTLIVFFCYFYTAIIFNPHDIAENVKKYGGFIPGVRPGKPTADFIEQVLVRLTLVGAVSVGCIAIIPNIFFSRVMNIPFAFGGTAILILVGVALDTMKQIESHLLIRHYDGFMSQGKLRARAAF